MSTLFFILSIFFVLVAGYALYVTIANPFLLSKKADKAEARKEARSAVIGALFFALLCYGGHVYFDTPDIPKSEQATQANLVTYNTDRVEGKIQQSIASTVANSMFNTKVVTLQKIEINKLNGGYNVNVWAKLTDKAWDNESALNAIKLMSIPVYKGAYTSGQPVENVQYIVMADMTDGKGNTSERKAFQSSLRKDTAKTFNWNNADAISTDLLNKDSFTHPALRKK